MHRAGPSDELWRFSTATLQWELLGAAADGSVRPSARESFGMTAVGEAIYVFGGYTDEGE